MKLSSNHLIACLLGLFMTSHVAAMEEPIGKHCQGAGQSVYLIGGGPAFTTWNLAPVQQALASQYMVCRWDMRGVGDNARLSLAPDTPALTQWLADMRRVLPEEPVVLWGHSWGALQVLLFAKHFPQRVERIVLSNPVDPGMLSLVNIEFKRFQHPDDQVPLHIDDIGTPIEALHNLRSKIASYFIDARKGWDYARRFTHTDTNSALNVQIWEEYRRQMLSGTDVQRLADKIAGVVYCRQDVLQPEALLEYRRILGNTSHVVLEGCAHFPWEETPAAYFRALHGLLNKPE